MTFPDFLEGLPYAIHMEAAAHEAGAFADEELFADAIAAESTASGNRWRAADDYSELNRRGYTVRAIAERVSKSPAHIGFCLKAVSVYPGRQERPDFQYAYDQAKSTAHLTSNTDEWETPQDLFDELDQEFAFDLDVCASPTNAKCERFFTHDGLDQEWAGTCWMNPPYSQIETWLTKAHTSSLAGALVVCLVPSRTDVTWFWELARHAQIRFLRGRLHFTDDEGNTGPAPFPSCLVIFGHPPGLTFYDRRT